MRDIAKHSVHSQFSDFEHHQELQCSGSHCSQYSGHFPELVPLKVIGDDPRVNILMFECEILELESLCSR